MNKIVSVYEVFVYCDSKIDSQNKTLKEIADNIPELVDDNNFHFLYEANYLLIRFSPSLKKKIINTLKKLKHKYECFDYWNEQSDSIIDNPEFFTEFLHGISVISLKTDNDYSKIFERIVHLSFLIFAHQFFKEAGIMPMLESRIISGIAIRRAFMEGNLLSNGNGKT